MGNLGTWRAEPGVVVADRRLPGAPHHNYAMASALGLGWIRRRSRWSTRGSLRRSSSRIESCGTAHAGLHACSKDGSKKRAASSVVTSPVIAKRPKD